MKQLKKSEVIFIENEILRGYFLKDKELSGITSYMSSTYLFRDKFKFVKGDVLEKAASRGTDIHKNNQAMDEGKPYLPLKEVLAYQKIKEEHGITPIANEFIVSDEKTFATQIDMIADDYKLYDFKTSQVLDKEYVSIQLSMNAYLLERQCEVVVPAIYAIHLPKKGNAKLVQLERKSDEFIKDFFYTDKFLGEAPDESSDLPLVVRDDTIQLLTDVETKLVRLDEELKKLKGHKEELMAIVEEKMRCSDIYEAKIGRLIFKRKKDYQRSSFDHKAFLDDNPTFEGKYMKTTDVKGGVSLKIEKE